MGLCQSTNAYECMTFAYIYCANGKWIYAMKVHSTIKFKPPTGGSINKVNSINHIR